MWLHPSALILALAVALDIVLGDPVYPAHPVRLMGYSLVAFEKILRRIGANGYLGGVVLFLLLCLLWVGGTIGLLVVLAQWRVAFLVFQLFFAYSCLALHDLLRHAWAVESAARKND